MQELKEGTVLMVANIGGKIFSKSFDFRKYDVMKGFEALKRGFITRVLKETVTKEAEGIANGKT